MTPKIKLRPVKNRRCVAQMELSATVDGDVLVARAPLGLFARVIVDPMRDDIWSVGRIFRREVQQAMRDGRHRLTPFSNLSEAERARWSREDHIQRVAALAALRGELAKAANLANPAPSAGRPEPGATPASDALTQASRHQVADPWQPLELEACVDGRVILTDGHHRLAAALVRQEKTIYVALFGFEEAAVSFINDLWKQKLALDAQRAVRASEPLARRSTSRAVSLAQQP